MKDGVYGVTAPHFCAGFVVEGGKIVRIAPIIKYMKDWDLSRILQYTKSKRWKFQFISP